MAKQIVQVGTLKAVLTGSELVEIQEPLGGIGSSKRTTAQAIADLAIAAIPTAPVQSVQGRYGGVVIVAEDIGLENVDNTSDLDKPVSTAQQNALDLKANIAGQVFLGEVDAPSLLEGGIQVVTVATYNGHFDARLAEVLSSTSQLPEGDNLYYTQERVDSRVGELLPTTDALPEGGSNLYFTGLHLFNQVDTLSGIYKAYDPETGIVTLVGAGEFPTPAVVMVNGQQGIVELDSDDVPEGAGNKYFQDAPQDGLDYVRRNGAYAARARGVEVLSLAAEATLEAAAHGGRDRLLLTQGDITLDFAEEYEVGTVFNIYSELAGSILGVGGTVFPMNGGTLLLGERMGVTLIVTHADEAVAIGMTEQAT